MSCTKRKINIKDFEVLANSLQIPEKAYRNSFKKFASMNNDVHTIIDASFLRSADKIRYKSIWEGKQALLNEI